MDWVFDWGESHSAISVACWTRYYATQRRFFGAVRKNSFSLVENRQLHNYVKKYDNLQTVKEGKKLLEESFLRKVFRQSDASRKNFFELYGEKEKMDLRQLSNAELAGLFNRYVTAYERLLPCFSASQPEFLKPAEKALKGLLNQNSFSDEQINSYFTILTAPCEVDAIKREEMDFLKAALLGDETPLLEHAKKHPWLFFNTYSESTAVSFLKEKALQLGKISEAEVLLKTNEIRRKNIELANKQKEILAGLQGSEQASELALIFQKSAIDRMETKAVWGGAEFLFQNMFREIAARVGETIDDFMWTYNIEDILNFLEREIKLSKGEIAGRKKFYLFWLDNLQLRFFSGEEALRVAEKEVGFKKEISVAEISGTIACPGKAKGNARVILVRDLPTLEKDLREFKKGEVMVTTMTQPTMVLIASKAAAIVTDEGGLTSHASILAREFGIPCIVGTRLATKAIKTGDLIEVDANKGTVRKL